MKYIFINLIILNLFISGCSIKQDDSLFRKSVKHTVNIPLYIIVGLWFSDAITESYIDNLKKSNQTYRDIFMKKIEKNLIINL